jgi:flavin reductase (DIM6/NTAB) family NADH-FMN oxidoreductase RutF
VESAAQTFIKLTVGLSYPMFIVTTAVGDQRDGCLIGFATQSSVHPGRFLACLSRKNRTLELAREAEALAVHLVPRAEMQLAELFGGETGDEIDKFEHCAWREGPEGMPILAACASWFVGAIASRHDLGDHEGYLLAPIAAHHEPGGELLYFDDVRHIEPGHEA